MVTLQLLLPVLSVVALPMPRPVLSELVLPLPLPVVACRCLLVSSLGGDTANADADSGALPPPVLSVTLPLPLLSVVSLLLMVMCAGTPPLRVLTVVALLLPVLSVTLPLPLPVLSVVTLPSPVPVLCGYILPLLLPRASNCMTVRLRWDDPVDVLVLPPPIW